MKSTYYFPFCLALILLIGVQTAHALPTRIAEDGMLLLDGKRTFIVGLYQEAKDDRFAKEAAQTGFNLIRSAPTKESLDRTKAAGLQCWIPLGMLAASGDEQTAALESTVSAFKNHPALAVWEGPDEALWNAWWLRWNQAGDRWNQLEKAIQKFQGTPEQTENGKKLEQTWKRCRESGRYEQAEECEDQIRILLGLPAETERLSDWVNQLDLTLKQLTRGTHTVRRTDPDHVLWFNHAPRNSLKDLTRFGAVPDIIGCDIYPVPFGPAVGHSDLAERNLPSVGQYTRRMARSVRLKPVWMVLQGFGWDDLASTPPAVPKPRPTFKETRFMAYDAIVNSARGILYWGTHAVPWDSQLISDIRAVVSELRDLQPFLSAPDATDRVTLTLHPNAGSDEKGVVMLAKEVDGRWALIVVNESDQPLAFDISNLRSLNGSRIDILNEPETLTVKNGSLTYGLPPLGVSVLLGKPKE